MLVLLKSKNFLILTNTMEVYMIKSEFVTKSVGIIVAIIFV